MWPVTTQINNHTTPSHLRLSSDFPAPNNTEYTESTDGSLRRVVSKNSNAL